MKTKLTNIFEVTEEDLKTLYVSVRFCLGSMTFESFKLQCKNDYEIYAMNVTYPKTYAQWINGQILALNY